ncbi:Plasmodium vivax Vir protein, putative [Plasmodium vivax]|uniref:Vir protein, putative n=1 Tax=Plasmodium vivax TaxID=5855 RepID=A0A1G4E533_PLAVI|nr:Plasmodium vivax Vir protein, putative [Plasmodium vivax]
MSQADCDNFSTQYSLGNIEKSKSLCNNFARLNQLLVAIKTNEHNHCKFLNYWFNSELSQTGFRVNKCIRDIHNGMDSQLVSSKEYISLNCELYNIKKDDLNKMNILYNLYENYSELKNITDDTSNLNKQSLFKHSCAFCPHYLEASYICNPGNSNSSIFCQKINDLKSKNDALYEKVHGERADISDNFVRLSECPNNKIITTAVTGSIIGLMPLLGVLYKFTPMVQVLRSKMGILNNDISKNDEEMIKMSLMDQENEQIPFQKKTYNIKYQSL